MLVQCWTNIEPTLGQRLVFAGQASSSKELRITVSTVVQKQTAVTAYLKSKQLLLFAFAGKQISGCGAYKMYDNSIVSGSSKE